MRNGRKAKGWQKAYEVTECSAYRRYLNCYDNFIFRSFTLFTIVGKLEIVYVCDDAGIWSCSHISCRPDIRLYVESRGVLIPHAGMQDKQLNQTDILQQ